jgi:biopolymer transport protein ExbD
VKRRKRQSHVNSEINVTPLVDVVLVLLIIFMVVTPYLQQGFELKLPFASNSEQGEANDEPMIVSVTASGDLYLGTERTTREQLVTELRAAVERDPTVEIMVKGDQDTRFGKIRELMEWMRDAGAPAAALATQREEQG